MPTKLLVGVGNPGEDFYLHRHNIGFRVIDLMAEELGINFKYDKKKSIFGKKKINGEEVIVLKPQTFINLSGEAVLYIASFLKVDIKNVLVVFDDIDLSFGSLQMTKGRIGQDHSAIKHIEISLNNTKFSRLAFGIGSNPRNVLLEDFYLSPFTPKEEKKLPELLEKGGKMCMKFLNLPTPSKI